MTSRVERLRSQPSSRAGAAVPSRRVAGVRLRSAERGTRTESGAALRGRSSRIGRRRDRAYFSGSARALARPKESKTNEEKEQE